MNLKFFKKYCKIYVLAVALLTLFYVFFMGGFKPVYVYAKKLELPYYRADGTTFPIEESELYFKNASKIIPNFFEPCTNESMSVSVQRYNQSNELLFYARSVDNEKNIICVDSLINEYIRVSESRIKNRFQYKIDKIKKLISIRDQIERAHTKNTIEDSLYFSLINEIDLKIDELNEIF